jgi:hypothetical protein
MPDLEALGDAVTGAVLAGAVEPRTGEAAEGQAADGHTHEANCLNCGAKLAGDYCHVCGQRAHVHRTLSAFWHDVAHGVLHFEGKIWRTLPLLAWKPGELTRRFVRGERARFVSPIALFLFSVFLMFAVFSLVGGPLLVSDMPTEDRAQAEREFAAERADAKQDLAKLQQELAQARAARQPTSGIEARITSRRRELTIQESAYRLAMGAAAREEQIDKATGGREPVMNLIGDTGWAPLDRAIAKAAHNPSLLFYKLQTNAYKFSWLLIPISLPFVWLLFLHRRRYRQEYGAYDHLIFVTYSIAFMSLGAIALALLRPLGEGSAIIGLAVTFIPPIHVYRQLRGAYQLSRWSAVWRTFVLIICTFIALALFLAVLLVLGVLG